MRSRPGLVPVLGVLSLCVICSTWFAMVLPTLVKDCSIFSASSFVRGDRQETEVHGPEVNPTARPSPARRKISVELASSARLGNMMFAHASLAGIADRNRMRRVVQRYNFRLLFETFDIDADHVSETNVTWRKREERSSNIYDATLAYIDDGDDVRLSGYLQSWRYFDHMRETIRNDFRFRWPVQKRARQFVTNAIKRHYPDRKSARDVLTVGIHVRPG